MTRSVPQRGEASSSFPRRSRSAASVVAALLAILAVGSPLRAEPDRGAPAQSGSPPAPGNGPSAAAAQIEFSPFNDRQFVEARKSGSPVVLYFEADWCAPCKEMHARTFRAPAVLEAAAGARFFRVDMTKADHYVGLVQKSFRVSGTPTVILFGPDGKESGRRFGFIPPDDFARMLGESRKPPQST